MNESHTKHFVSVAGNMEYISAGKCGIAFNTDGILPFKSSNLTVWPITLALTILPSRVCWYKDN